jgi:hypothetical protein
MAEQRLWNWDWVNATHQCKAIEMFGRIRSLAERDVKTRNDQLKREQFRLEEVHGLQFSVGNAANWQERVFFEAEEQRIVVCELNRVNEVVYTVALDDQGKCRLRRGVEWVDPWQVLQAALSPLFFKTSY